MEEEIRVRVPRDKEIIGVVEARLGSSRFRVRCQDDKIRICRVPGKFRKRLWVKEGNVVIVEPWEIQGDQSADIIWKYTPTQISWLRNKGILKMVI